MSSSLQIDSFLVPLVLFPIIMVFAMLLVYTAWLNDDAYITFRTVDNFVNGYGLTWNTSERVETYSNPLWMFLVSIPYFFTNEIYYTAIILSITVSVIAVLIFAFKISKTVIGAILGIGIFIASKPFIDWSTSGLENPLTHLILGIFLLVYIKSMKKFSVKTLFLLSIITAFGAINRLDTVVFFLPCLVFVFLKLPKIKGAYVVTMGLVPAIIWKGLALFYYGFPFPNTAYAKVLNTGISKTEYLQHGFYYFQDLIVWHTFTFFIIMAGMAIPFIIKEKRLMPVTLGVVLYLIFIVQIGGDFNTGRFYSAPLFVAIILISQYNFKSFKRIPLLVLSAIIIIAGVMTPPAPVFAEEYLNPERQYHGYGISDGRAYHLDFGSSLFNNLDNVEVPHHLWAKWGSEAGKRGQSPMLFKSIGMFGFYAGPEIHIVDWYAISDPLISKIPISKDQWWVIGHFTRIIPSGYMDTLESGENVIEDECLAKYYDKLSIITRGDLFDVNRIQEIWNMNTGQYDYLLDAYIHGKENVQNSDC